MRFSSSIWLIPILGALLACGSRTPLDLGNGPAGSGSGDDDDAGSTGTIDASDSALPVPPPTPPNPPVPPGGVLPEGYVCYGDATTVHGVTCFAQATSGTTCDGHLSCDGDHEFTIHCEDGLCRCVNVGFNQCLCEATAGLADPCGERNCCWRPSTD